MPEGMVPGQPGQQQAPQPPFGASPATGPTVNKGYEAAASQRLGIIIKQLTELLPLTGVTSDIGKAVLDMLKTGAKYAGQGSAAQEKHGIDNLAMRNNQQAQQAAQLRQQMAGGGQPGGAAPGGAPGGAMPGAGGGMPPGMPRAA